MELMVVDWYWIIIIISVPLNLLYKMDAVFIYKEIL